MKHLINIIMLFSITFFIGCKQDQGEDEWRGKFDWNGWINSSYHSNWEINCNVTCTQCYYIEDGVSKELDKDKYEEIYEECENLPFIEPKVIDTTVTTVVTPLGKVTFKKSTSTKFGYDAWKTGSTERTPNEAYISVATGDSTEFVIKVASSLDSMYDDVIAVLPSDAHGNISFNKTTDVDTFNLGPGDNVVKVYADAVVTDGNSYYVNVYGVTDPDKPACLAGDCYGSEDKIKVVVYQNRIYKNIVLYRVNTPPFNPDTTQWRNEFNKIIKQGVIEIDSFNKQIYSDLNWDKNGNGLLDIFVSNDDVPADKYEPYYLLDSLKELNRCADDNGSAVIVVNGELHSHWVITENVATGDSVIKLNTINSLTEGDKIIIGPWLGIGSGVNEDLYIQRINETDTTIIVSQDADGNTMGVAGIHSRHETFWTEIANGFTIASCSFINGSPAYQTIVHETLHQVLFGHLFDLHYYPENLMHGYKSSRTGSELCYREITNLLGLPEWQWDMLHQ